MPNVQAADCSEEVASDGAQPGSVPLTSKSAAGDADLGTVKGQFAEGKKGRIENETDDIKHEKGLRREEARGQTEEASLEIRPRTTKDAKKFDDVEENNDATEKDDASKQERALEGGDRHGEDREPRPRHPESKGRPHRTLTKERNESSSSQRHASQMETTDDPSQKRPSLMERVERGVEKAVNSVLGAENTTELIISKQTYINMKNRIKSQEEAISNNKKTTAMLSKQILTLQAECQNLEIKSQRYLADARSFYQERNQAQQKLIEMNAILDEREDSVMKAQESAMRMLDHAHWHSEADGDMSRAITGMYNQVRQWCRKVAVKSINDTNTESDDVKGEIRELVGVIARLDSDQFSNLLKDNDSRAGAILLTACVMNFLFSKIVADPLYFLFDVLESAYEPVSSAPTASTKENTSEDEIMEDYEKPADCQSASEIRITEDPLMPYRALYDQIKQCNRSGAASWRALLLRLLDPPLQPNHPKVNNIKELKEKFGYLRERGCRRLAQEFLASNASHLMRKPIGEALEREFQSVFLEAGDISLKLATQKREVVLDNINDLPTLYSHGSALLEPHPLHNAQLDDDERSLEKLPLLVVVQPAVTLFGDIEGIDMRVSSVISKAIVWLGARPPTGRHD